LKRTTIAVITIPPACAHHPELQPEGGGWPELRARFTAWLSPRYAWRRVTFSLIF